MKIPNNLDQFDEEESLILVTGKQDAVIYRAFKGTLHRLDSFKISRPGYSDKEGIVKKYHDNASLVNSFVGELAARLKKLGAENYESLYLFTPSYVKNRIKDVLPANLRSKIKMIIEGNYFTFGPINLLSRMGT